jgi:hypothetical protein
MFERVGDLAERVATNVSRRAFLGRLGQSALGLAAVIGGVLAFPGQAQGAGDLCCVIAIVGPCRSYKAVKGTCPCSGNLVDCRTVRRCVLISC